MDWTIDASVAPRLIAQASAARTMGTPVRMLGRSMPSADYLAMLADAFGIADPAAAGVRGVRDALSARLGQPLPYGMAFNGSPLPRADDATLGMCRAWGVDAWRLLVSSGEGTARCRRGSQEISIGFAGYDRDGGPQPMRIRLRLSKDVTWRDGALVVSRLSLPHMATGQLVGRSVADVVEHDWEGWKDLRIVSVRKTGTGTTMITDAPGIPS